MLFFIVKRIGPQGTGPCVRKVPLLLKFLLSLLLLLLSGVRGDSGPRDNALLLATEGAGAPIPESGHLHQKSRAGET